MVKKKKKKILIVPLHQAASSVRCCSFGERWGRCGAGSAAWRGPPAAAAAFSHTAPGWAQSISGVKGSQLWTYRTHLDRCAAMLPLQGGPSAAPAALLFYSLFLETTLVLAFNLDTGNVIRKDGEPGSLFGFSLAMHRQLNPDKRL